MSFKITKATCKMVNGDNLIIKEPITVQNVDDYREELHSKYECKSIILVYEEERKHPVPESVPAT